MGNIAAAASPVGVEEAAVAVVDMWAVGGAMSASELAAVMAATVGIAVGIIMDARGIRTGPIMASALVTIRRISIRHTITAPIRHAIHIMATAPALTAPMILTMRPL